MKATITGEKMDKCCRCEKEIGFGSVIPLEVKGDKVKLVHFYCATPEEVRTLYGKGTDPEKTTPVVPIGDPEKK